MKTIYTENLGFNKVTYEFSIHFVIKYLKESYLKIRKNYDIFFLFVLNIKIIIFWNSLFLKILLRNAKVSIKLSLH